MTGRAVAECQTEYLLFPFPMLDCQNNTQLHVKTLQSRAWVATFVIDIAQNYDVMFDGAVALYKVQEWYCGDQIITLSNKVKRGWHTMIWLGI